MKQSLITKVRRWLPALIGAVAIVLFLPGMTMAQNAKPTPTVEKSRIFITKLAADAIEVMRTSKEDNVEREAKFRALLENGFHLPSIGRLVLGRHWRTASPEQRSEYLSLFSEYVIKTYAILLSHYDNEEFKFQSATLVGKRDMVVNTKIVRPSGPPISTDWRVRIIDGEYRIIDVKIEGISMVQTQRSEFSSVVQRKGMDALIGKLRDRIKTASVQSVSVVTAD